MDISEAQLLSHNAVTMVEVSEIRIYQRIEKLVSRLQYQRSCTNMKKGWELYWNWCQLGRRYLRGAMVASVKSWSSLHVRASEPWRGPASLVLSNYSSRVAACNHCQLFGGGIMLILLFNWILPMFGVLSSRCRSWWSRSFVVYDPNKLEKAHVIHQVLEPGTFTPFVLHLVR